MNYIGHKDSYWLITEVGSNELHLRRYIYLSTFFG